ncbi:MAG TPA: hypothetical protein VEB42_14875, partial [Chitinophagaceae bacterium]|nr:hypothetical protein [Chitinophagaceae bacterium]
MFFIACAIIATANPKAEGQGGRVNTQQNASWRLFGNRLEFKPLQDWEEFCKRWSKASGEPEAKGIIHHLGQSSEWCTQTQFQDLVNFLIAQAHSPNSKVAHKAQDVLVGQIIERVRLSHMYGEMVTTHMEILEFLNQEWPRMRKKPFYGRIRSYLGDLHAIYHCNTW